MGYVPYHLEAVNVLNDADSARYLVGGDRRRAITLRGALFVSQAPI